MITGTTLVDVKQAIVTALRARSGLTGVQVLYGPDDFPSGDDHLEDESIWLGNATWDEYAIPVLKAGTKKVDEDYELEFFLQVLKRDGTTQEAADIRARVLLIELQQALAENPAISDHIFWAQLRLRNHITGQFAAGPGHGSRFEGVINVRARLFP